MTRHKTGETMNDDRDAYEDEYILEHYKALRERYTSQGNRLWNRFNFFLTVNVAIAGGLIAGKNVDDFPKSTLYGPLIGIVFSLIWLLIGAQDLWYYDNSRKKLENYRDRLILPKIPDWGTGDEEKELPKWTSKRMLRFKIPRIGVTTFSAIIPLVAVVSWTITLVIRHYY